MRIPLLLLSLTALISSPSVAKGNFSRTFCTRLAQFHDASFDGAEQPAGRRWIEMHWQGFWLDFDHGFGLKCESSPDAISRSFCGWLEKHTSFEFPALLPKAIYRCDRHIRPEPEWEMWTNSVAVVRDHRLLQVEVNLEPTKTESGVLRLSSFGAGKDEGAVPLPPLIDASN